MNDLDIQLPFTGNAATALDHIAAALSSNGFKITKRAAYEVELTGPPTPNTAHEMTRFWGVSRLRVSQEGNALRLRAEMGVYNHCDKLGKRIVAGLLIAGAVALGVMLALMEGQKALSDPAAWMILFGAPAAIVAITLGMMRMISPKLETRMAEAFETLLNNAVMLAGQR